MEKSRSCSLLISYISLFYLFSSPSPSPSGLPIGIHPLDEKYYAPEVIKCKDGSNIISRNRINDNFCDCSDGTDEPGTSACPTAKFYCKNLGSKPQFLFSSRVNDHFCDCCDGSDEYDGSIICPNTCVMGGNVAYKTISYGSAIRDLGSINSKGSNTGVIAEDTSQKLKGVKVVIILQAVLLIIVVTFRLFHRRFRVGRRHLR